MTKVWYPFLLAASASIAGCNETHPPTYHSPARHDESVTRDMETQIAHATRVGDSRVHVEMRSRAGAELFSVDIQPTGADQEAVAWRLPQCSPTGSAGGVTSGTLPVALAELPALDDAIDMAAFVESRVIGGLNGQDYDHWGCDLPFTKVSSCNRKGACCDTHDDCYARNHCTASSWVNPFASKACRACNGNVLRCIAHSSPGPSVCCSKHSCGKPR